MSGWDEFESKGAQRFKSALSSFEIERIAPLFGDEGTAGRRLGEADLVPIATLLRTNGPIGRIAAYLIGGSARPVRAIAFDKSPERNWRLGWHQDRVIAVRERIDVDGFRAWSRKSGQLHVQPPFAIIGRMATLRVHLDPVDEENAPLQIVAGSHKHGPLPDQEVQALADAGEVITCTAQAGDVWAYSTPVVHASAEQQKPGRRRVLQVDYARDDLPGGLEWQTLV